MSHHGTGMTPSHAAHLVYIIHLHCACYLHAPRFHTSFICLKQRVCPPAFFVGNSLCTSGGSTSVSIVVIRAGHIVCEGAFGMSWYVTAQLWYCGRLGALNISVLWLQDCHVCAQRTYMFKPKMCSKCLLRKQALSML